MVVDALVYHPSVAHYLRFVATTVGRDKVLRTLQYFARFYAWYLFRTNATKDQIKPWETIKKQFGMTRKTLRLGKNIEHFKAAAVAYDSKSTDPIIKFCAIGRQLGYGFYLSYDALAWLDGTGIKKLARAKDYSQFAARAWFTGLFFNIIAGFYKKYLQNQKAASINKKDAEAAVQAKALAKEVHTTNLQLISDLCDICNPATSLGITNFDDGIIGIAGTTSSLIGLYNQWQKTA